MDQGLLALHAKLLEEKPDGVEHDKATCPLCALEADPEHANAPGGESVSESFTKEQVDEMIAKAVEEATVPLQAKLDDLGKAAKETEVGKAVAEATAPLEAQVEELQKKVDDAEVAKTAAETAKAEIEEFWTTAITESEEAAARDTRKGERVEAAKAAGVLAEDYITANADRFADMSEDDWSARLDEWKVIAEAAKTNGIPASTGFTASRETASENNNGSALTLLRSMRSGVKSDPRTL